MAVNLASYIKNLGKSVGYSAVEKVKKMNPTMVNLLETNEDLTKDLYKAVKNYKTILKNIPKYIKENEYYKLADQGIKNALEDLTTGKFYNVERIDKANAKLMGFSEEDDTLSDFGLDDDLDFDFDFNMDDIGDDDIFLANQMDEVGAKTSNAIAAATIESADYVANTTKASTKMLMDQNNRMMAEINVGMGAINNSVQQMIQFQETVHTHIENSTKFYETVGEKFDATNKMLSELLELEKKRASIEEKQEYKSNTITYSDIDSGEGSVDFKTYFKSIKKRLKAQTGGIFDMLGAFEGGNMLETMIASPLQFITDGLVDKLIDKSIKDANKRLDNSLKGFFGSLMNKFNNMASDSDGITGILAQIFGVSNRLKRSINVSEYVKGPMPFNGKANKAITEVIPTQLSEIISILNGTSQQLFDYDKGIFTTRERILDEKNNELDRQALSAASDIRYELRGMMKNISFDTFELKETIRKDIDKMLKDMFKSGTFLDIYDDEFDLPGVTDPRSKKYIRAMLKNVSRDKMLELNSKVMEGRDRYTRRMQDRELSGSSYNYLEDGFDYSRLAYKVDKEGKKEIDKSKDRSLLSMLSIDRVKDNLGHNIFFYLQNINNELSYIRNNGTLGQGSNGGYYDEFFTSRGIVSREKLPPEFKNEIKDESERSKKIREDLDREISKNRAFDERKLKEREANPSMIKAEEIDKLEGKEFDRALLGAANRFRESEENKKNKVDRKFYGPKTLIDDLLAADTVAKKSKVIVENVKDIAAQPAKLIASAMDSADRALYTIIYGDKRDKDGKRKSFLNELIEQMKLQFLKFNTWIDTNILTPIKDKLKIESFRDIPEKIFSFFGIDIHETMDNFKKYIFGEYDVDAQGNRVQTREGLLTPIAKGIEQTFDEFGQFLDDALSPVIDPIRNILKGKEKTGENTEGEDTVDELTSSSSSTNNQANKLYADDNVRKVSDKAKALEEQQKMRRNTKPNEVNGKNSYNLAGGYADKLDYKNLDKRIKKYQKPEYYNIEMIRTELNALLEEKEKYKTYLPLFTDILGNKDGERATTLLLQDLGSKGIDINDLTLEEVYQHLLHLGEYTYISKGKEVKGGFYKTRTGKQLIQKFDKFADDASYFDIYNNLGNRNKTKLHSAITGTKGLDRNNLDLVLNPTKKEDEENEKNRIISATKQAEDALETYRDRQSKLETTFSAIGRDVNTSNNRLVDEIKSIHNTIKAILRVIKGPDRTPIEGETNFIGPLQQFSNGGVVDFPEDTVVPALLSGGEIVYNPADKKTRKEQGKREELVRDLFLKNKIHLLSEGAEIEEDGTVNPLREEGKEIIINRRKRKVFEVDGNKYVKVGKKYYYEIDDFTRRGYEATRYYEDKDNPGTLKIDNPHELKNPKSNIVKKAENGDYEEGQEPIFYRAMTTATNGFKDTVRALGITKDDSDNFNKAVGDVVKNSFEYAPATIASALIGSGVSLVTGAIGGPLLGAAVGAGVGLVRKSDKVQQWLSMLSKMC